MSQAPERRRYPAMALLRWLLYEPQLDPASAVSSTAAHVLGVVAAQTRPNGVTRITVPALAACVGASERTVQRALGELLAHRRAPLRRYLGDHHDASAYEVTAHAYAAWDQRGVYARFAGVEEAPPKAPAGGAPQAAAGSSGGVTAVSPQDGGADESGVSSMSPLISTGVTSVTAGVTNLSGRGDSRVTPHLIKQETEGTDRRAAAAVRGEQQQQQRDRGREPQRPADRREAEELLAAIVGARRQRVELRAAGLLEADDVASDSAPAVLARVAAFIPAPGRPPIRVSSLDSMSGPYLERSLLDLRVEARRERAALERELAESAVARERADDADSSLPGVVDASREKAQSAWQLVAPRATDEHGDMRARLLWMVCRDLEAVGLVGGALLVRAPYRGWSVEGTEQLQERAQGAGLTCRVVVGTYGELRAWLRAQVPQEAAG